MNAYKPSDWEDVAMRVQALRAAEEAFHKNGESVIPTIRRISRSLHLVEGAGRMPEIESLAKTLRETRDADLAPMLSKVIPRLSALVTNLQTKKHCVLVVEDDPLTSQVLQRRLGDLHQVVAAYTLAEAEKIIQHQEVSLILLDLQLPDGDGREFLLKLRERLNTSTIPIFVASGEKGSQVQTECYALGADAFFSKPFDPLTLATAVAAKLQKNDEITHRTSVDSLTGLPNRAGFISAFARESRLASRSKEPLTVAILDVDRFKAVNDLYGHPTGDVVLRRLAQIVSKSLRASDLLGRWGGEEFAAFFPNTALREACVALNKALKAFRAEQFTTSNGLLFQVTFSAGVAQTRPGMTAEQAVAEADRFLYRAKEGGRDQIMTERNKVSTKKNVLLIEDDELTARVMRRCLIRDGFKVIRAKESASALKAVDTSISLITLDVKIPGMDGFELLQRFRRIPALREVPIVMLTSSGKQEDIIRGFNLGADDYIVKPFSPREFLARVHRFLQKH